VTQDYESLRRILLSNQGFYEPSAGF